MTGGVSTTSFSKAATWAGISGTWSSNYPAANLGDLRRPSKVARVTPASGAAAFSAVLAASSQPQCFALVNHNAPAGATMRVRCYSDAAMTVLADDSGVLGLWPPLSEPSAGYRAVRPWVTAVGVKCRAVRVDFAGLSGDLDIGAFEIAEWWEWPISPGADVGFREGADPIPLVGGGSEGVEQFLPRAYDGQIDYLALAAAGATAIDFQKLKGRTEPFVFVEDYDDVASWTRTCFLATNSDLPPLVGALYRHDRYQFRLREHLR